MCFFVYRVCGKKEGMYHNPVLCGGCNLHAQTRIEICLRTGKEITPGSFSNISC